MWLKKKEYDKLKSIQELYVVTEATNNDLCKRLKELSNEQEAVTLKEVELTKLLIEAQKIIDNKSVKYTTVKEPERDEQGNYDFGYYENITQIINNRYFQWFLYNFREEIISQVAYNMGVKVNFFLANNEEIAGGIKVIDHLIQSMERVRLDHNTIIEAEKNAETERDNEV